MPDQKMQIGVVFPQTEIGSDPIAVRDYVQAAEQLGYAHIIAYDHVMGADTDHHQPWTGSYTKESMFHEIFVLFGYMAAVTTSVELVSAVLILGQRQTALVAKQAAEIDVLSGGRLRLGVGVGWNHVEYEALSEDFTTRGRRAEEQMDLLRRLWTEESVDFHGRYHNITDAGINPLPVQRPIPIWMGAGSRRSGPVPVERVLSRVGRCADGWFPQFQPDEPQAEAIIAKVRQYAADAGRDPDAIGMEPRVNYSDGDPEFWQARAEAWRGFGASHFSVNTMSANLSGPDAHINAIREFKDVITD
jgi:probable F420-dependent oxidoreductase